MSDASNYQPVFDPQKLATELVARQRAGDADGMAALYEPNAVLDCGNGRLAQGREQIRAFYEELIATGVKFQIADQRPALIHSDLALTSSLLPNGNVTAEVAHRQSDGTWLWVIDQPSIS
jgi:uncharacterized protein (TIGR02246 family)